MYKRDLPQDIKWAIGLALFFLFLYGCYWVFKTFSYWLFYGDMVKSTITEMVKSGCLN